MTVHIRKVKMKKPKGFNLRAPVVAVAPTTPSAAKRTRK